MPIPGSLMLCAAAVAWQLFVAAEAFLSCPPLTNASVLCTDPSQSPDFLSRHKHIFAIASLFLGDWKHVIL